MSQQKILVVGDANADLAATVGRFPHEGDDCPVGELQWGSGGTGVNVAAALARLGATVRLLARVGQDPAAAVALQGAQAAGVDCSLVQRDPQLATGLCYALISPGGERTFLAFRGANVALAPSAALQGVQWVHICAHALLEGPQRQVTLDLLHQAQAADLPISLDLCLPYLRARPAELPELVPHLTLLFGNDPEIGLLAPSGPEPLANHGATLVIKRGALGCRVLSGKIDHHAPAFAVTARDTTGCGDGFVAGYLQATLAGAGIAHCARYANAVGALIATRLGAADITPQAADVAALLAEHGEIEE